VRAALSGRLAAGGQKEPSSQARDRSGLLIECEMTGVENVGFSDFQHKLLWHRDAIAARAGALSRAADESEHHLPEVVDADYPRPASSAGFQAAEGQVRNTRSRENELHASHLTETTDVHG
jgi:hypothetical protein